MLPSTAPSATGSSTPMTTSSAAARSHAPPASAAPELGGCACACASSQGARMAALGGSALLEGEAGPFGALPLPRVLERAASKVADSAAFDHPGTSSSAASGRAIRSCGWATDRRSAAYPPPRLQRPPPPQPPRPLPSALQGVTGSKPTLLAYSLPCVPALPTLTLTLTLTLTRWCSPTAAPCSRSTSRRPRCSHRCPCSISSPTSSVRARPSSTPNPVPNPDPNPNPNPDH